MGCSFFIFNPSYLQQPVLLAAGIVCFIITLSQTLLNLENCYSMFMYNSKIMQTQSNHSTSTTLLFSLKNFFLIISNALLFSSQALLISNNLPLLSLKTLILFAPYHLVCMARDYFSSPSSFDFLSVRSNLPSLTISNNDPRWMLEISDNINPDILDKHQVRCQISKINDPLINNEDLEIELTPSILFEPVLLQHKTTQQKIWTDRSTALRFSRLLSSWSIYDHSNQEVQNKIAQIRSLLTTLYNRKTNSS